MPFISMVKFAIASIPAFIVLMFIFMLFGVMFGGVFHGMGIRGGVY
ncbi:MAG: hypothetical protein OQK77_14590 [Psychromonas sp.]|nr:hypothetical protein [Psychromonas sp.]